MNQENQTIEWKESWRDEQLKTICGFANAQGGSLFVGKNDHGEIVGLKDVARLLEEIPNKVRDVLGILVNIYQHRSETFDFLQIEVESYAHPMDLLLTKYLRAYISYEDVQRFDTFPIPETALREALLNAIAHKDYASGAPIQIKVYENKLSIWNTGKLPESWTIETLLRNHHSAPYNPSVALVFFRAGLIESWGSGTLRIMADCVAAKVPKPTFQTDAVGFEIVFELIAPELNISDLSSKISSSP